MNEREQIKLGEALLDEIHTLISDEMNVMTTDVRFAIRRVGRAMSPKGENYLAAGVDLAKFLMSDQPICRGTRLMLAELVLGELRNPPRKPSVHSSHPKVIEAVRLYDFMIEKEGHTKESAKHHVHTTLGIPRSTLSNYIKMVRDREDTINRAKAGLKRPK